MIFANTTRAPLLLIAGGSDHLVPASVVESTFRRYQKSTARTDYYAFPGRCHWIIAQDGWDEVAEFILRWIAEAGGSTTASPSA